MTEALVLYVMLWADPHFILRIPMGSTMCAALQRQHDRTGRWPATECMPINWRPGQPLPWETRYQKARRNACAPDISSDCG